MSAIENIERFLDWRARYQGKDNQDVIATATWKTTLRNDAHLRASDLRELLDIARAGHRTTP